MKAFKEKRAAAKAAKAAEEGAKNDPNSRPELVEDDGGAPISPRAPMNNYSTEEEREEQNLEDRKRLWTRISGMIGKDLTSLISLPVTLFEPISVLQSMCEPLRNAHMLDKIAETEDALERLNLVSTFCVALFSHYSRTSKPFNPVLGETFEFVPADEKFKIIAEQVSHHPPIAVVCSTGAGWELSQESRIESKFWGTSVDVVSLGNNVLRLPKWNEEFVWKNPCATIHNILLGKLWVEHHGLLVIRNLGTGDTANIDFKKSGWFAGRSHEIYGEARNKDNRVVTLYKGKWNEYFGVMKSDEQEEKKIKKLHEKGEFMELWHRVLPDSEKTHRWKWDKFVDDLTLTTDDLVKILPSTDSRLRGDLRALAALDMKLAGREKNKIEEYERQKRRERESTGRKWTPVLFKKVPNDKTEYRWEYTGSYWDDRNSRKSSNAAPPIFVGAPPTSPDAPTSQEHPPAGLNTTTTTATPSADGNHHHTTGAPAQAEHTTAS